MYYVRKHLLSVDTTGTEGKGVLMLDNFLGEFHEIFFSKFHL